MAVLQKALRFYMILLLPFQLPLQCRAVWGPLLSYSASFFCIENDNYSLFFSIFSLFFFFFLNESSAELAADISIHFIFPDGELLLSLTCNSVFGAVSQSTFRWMAHTCSTYSAPVSEFGENTVQFHGNSLSMFTFNTLPLSFVIWCFPQH